MHAKLTFLKVNRLSLAAEARIIRRLANAKSGDLRHSLKSHRKDVLRPEARAAHLAHAFLTGTVYRRVERDGSSPPDWRRVAEKVSRFSDLGGNAARAAVLSWSEGKAPEAA